MSDFLDMDAGARNPTVTEVTETDAAPVDMDTTTGIVYTPTGANNEGCKRISTHNHFPPGIHYSDGVR